MEKESTGTALILLILGVLILWPFQAFTFQTGWQYFVQPLTGISLGFWHGFGVLGMLRYSSIAVILPKETQSGLSHHIFGWMYTGMALLTFHAIHWLMG